MVCSLVYWIQFAKIKRPSASFASSTAAVSAFSPLESQQSSATAISGSADSTTHAPEWSLSESIQSSAMSTTTTTTSDRSVSVNTVASPTGASSESAATATTDSFVSSSSTADQSQR